MGSFMGRAIAPTGGRDGTLHYGRLDLNTYNPPSHIPANYPVATGMAFVWLFRVIALAGAVVSASVTYATPLVSTVLGIVVLNEAVTWNQPVGAVIVLVGAALVQGLLPRSRLRSTQRDG